MRALSLIRLWRALNAARAELGLPPLAGGELMAVLKEHSP